MSEKEEERKTAQGELDDLLMVFGDLEEKVSKYKVGLSSHYVKLILIRPNRVNSKLWEKKFPKERMMVTAKKMEMMTTRRQMPRMMMSTERGFRCP